MEGKNNGRTGNTVETLLLQGHTNFALNSARYLFASDFTSWELNRNMTTCWDEKGNENNVIISGKQNKNFTWDSWNARSVAIAGTFSDWKPVRRNHNSLSWLDSLIILRNGFSTQLCIFDHFSWVRLNLYGKETLGLRIFCSSTALTISSL